MNIILRITGFSLLLFLHIDQSLGFKQSILMPKVKNAVNQEFVNAIENLVHRCLKNYYQTIYIISAVSDDNSEYFNNLKSDLLTKINKRYAVQLDNLESEASVVTQVRQNSVIFIDCIDDFWDVDKTIVPERFRNNGNFLFVLIKGYIEELQDIYDTLWTKNIFNCFTIYEHKGEIIFNSFLPFESPTTCGSTKPKIIAKYENGRFEENKFSVLKKLKNLHGCPIRVLSSEDPGYISEIKFPNGTIKYQGRGATFLEVLSSTINFTSHVTLKDGEMPWGIVYPNGTSTGNFGELQRNNGDVHLGDFFMSAVRNKYFDSSISMFTTPMVFIIPPGRPYRSIEKMLQPFERTVWIIILATIAVAVLVIGIINAKFQHLRAFIFGRGVKSPIINILIGMVGTQQVVLPGRNFARFILMMFLLLCLVLRSIYQGSVFQFLQSKKHHKEIQTIDEMIENDFTFYMFETAYNVMQNYPEIGKRSKLMVAIPTITGDEKIAALESLIEIKAVIKNGSSIRYCKESVLTFNIVIYFRKHFYLRNEINKKIDYLLSSGIIEYWVKCEFQKRAGHDDEDKGPRNLNLDDLKGPFVLMMGLHVVSIFVFILEVIIHRNQLRIMTKKFWIC
ncbi:uncharacterized protein [Chironomus tepperi]|uniref:uncharacterized protein n=1 Tax=Chironomus tepperi TaxID=113505 RepID=UPI00391F43F4